MRRLTVLDNVKLVSMIDDPKFSSFPCFKATASASRKLLRQVSATAGCSSCKTVKVHSSAQADAEAAMITLKKCINAMPKIKKNEMKRTLQTKYIRIHVPRSSGPVKITF